MDKIVRIAIQYRADSVTVAVGNDMYDYAFEYTGNRVSRITRRLLGSSRVEEMSFV